MNKLYRIFKFAVWELFGYPYKIGRKPVDDGWDRIWIRNYMKGRPDVMLEQPYVDSQYFANGWALDNLTIRGYVIKQ